MLSMLKQQPFKCSNFNYVIIDTDGGCDDCHALILLDYYIKKSGKTLLGISCCNGNTSIKNVILNVIISQQICHSQYPIYTGNDFNISGQSLNDNYFCQDGLGSKQNFYLHKFNIDPHNLYSNPLLQKIKSYQFIAQSAIKYQNDLVIIMIGPMTNLALAYHYNNQIINCFSNIISMSCTNTLTGMNSYFTAQFNSALDPESSYCVFQKFRNILLIPFDILCSQDSATIQHIFRDTSTQKSTYIKQIYNYLYQNKSPPTIGDPLTVLCLFKPQIIDNGFYAKIKIHVSGKRTRGCSIVDYFSSSCQNYNAFILSGINLDTIKSEMTNAYNSI